MIRIGLRDARSHFGRFIMSIIAIALGVAFVVGSFSFRQMLNNQVSEMLSTNADHDVYVRGSDKAADSDAGSTTSGSSASSYNSIDTALTSTLRDISGVAAATGTPQLSGLVLVANDGNAVTTSGAPTIGIAMGTDEPWRSAHFTSGTYPKGAAQVALHSFAASKAGLTTGDTTTVVFPDGAKKVKVSGIFDTSSTQAGAILLGLDPAVATDYANKTAQTPDTTSMIGVYGDLGNPLNTEQQQQLADRINAELPKSAKAHAITGDDERAEETKSTQDALGFVQPLILIFAVIALFVGSFIIANTFSMIVRESMRGYALLRSVGASPIQVFTTVIIQALLLGVVGSVAGIGLGWGMVKLIAMGLTASGTPMSASVNPSVSDMLVGLLVGVLVTLLGSVLPARRAALAPPIQAMNETVNPEKPVTLRAVFGMVMTILGIGLLLFSAALAKADGDGPTPWQSVNEITIGWPLGIGAGMLVIGVIVFGPALVSFAGAVLGWLPTLVFRVTGKLATRNISRSKRRTANTAAALFVGIAIVSCLGVVASSAKASVSGLIDTGMKADFAVTSASSGQLPQGAIDALKKVNGVKSTVSTRIILNVKYDGKALDSASDLTYATQPEMLTDVYAPEAESGNALKALRSGELVVGKDTADDSDWKVGDTVTVSTKNTEVDKAATAQAQQDYERQTQARVQELTAKGDAAGAKAAMDAAKKVDPKTFVRTKTVEATKRVKVGAILTNAVYRQGVMVSDALGDELGTSTTMFTMRVFVTAEPGVDVAALKQRLVKAVKSYYVVSVMDREEFKTTVGSMVDQILMILYALLALSIVIAIFGIVNTLALSVAERTKEIGLLRAIGTSRSQVRGMLGIEALIISVFGTLLGLAVGVFAGAVIRLVYESDGLEKLSIPWSQLLVFLVLSIVVGLVASISPANRALRKPVLDAVSSE